MTKILLPIDGSDCSQKTVRWAAETFDPRKTDYYLLRVVPVLPDLNTMEYDIVDASHVLNQIRKDLEALGCRVAQAEYVLGDVVERICDYAEAKEVDQVVLGSHGRTGLSRFLLGSISAKVLETCQRPVTIHRNVERKPASVR